MSNPLYIKALSKPFVFTNDLVCHSLKAMKPNISEAECILSALPASFKYKQRNLSFPPIIFYMLAASMTSSALIDGSLLTDDYDTPFEYLQEILTHFATSLVAQRVKPPRLLVDTAYTYYFLTSFCEKCGIELILVKELKYAYHFVSVALFEEGSSDAVVNAMGGNVVELSDYFETPEEFLAIYYPKFMKSSYAKVFSKDQLTCSRPYIESFSKKMWHDEGEIPHEWTEGSLKKIAALILHGDLKLFPSKSMDFLHVLASFLKFLDKALGCDISTPLLPAIGELHVY